MTQLHISNLAKSDLDEVWLYIAQDSPDIATAFISRIYDKCVLLANAPAMF